MSTDSERNVTPSRGRRFVTLAVAACTLGGLTVAGPGAHAAPSSDKPAPIVKAFKKADRSTAALFRWWWPSAVDADVAVRQLREVKAAGYRGVEIAFVMDGADYVVDPNEHEYGDAEWREALKAVLVEANKIGMQVDLTLGGRWPAAVPGLDVTSEAASQELVTADAVVGAGESFDAAAPAPAPRTYEERTVQNGDVVSETKTSPATLVAATAAQCLDACAEPNPQLDLSTVTELEINDGRIQWTAPDSGTWLVTAYWERGTAQRNDAPYGTSLNPLSAPESRVINQFNKAGAAAITEFVGRLLDARTRQLLRANGGSIFEDSLEIKAAFWWTPEFLETFERVNGYSLSRYLPLIAWRETSQFAKSAPIYRHPENQSEVAARVLRDVDGTLNRLFLDNHVKPVEEWANSLGLRYRAQPYNGIWGEPVDLGEAAELLDIAECESLGCNEARFRTLVGSVAMAADTLVSSEMLPGGFGNTYGLTPAQVAGLTNREYSYGANHMIFHGLPYPVIPPSADGTVQDGPAHWPGNHAFPTFIGEAFGSRNPTWTMERDVSAYYARAQRALRVGKVKFDLAVLNQSLIDTSLDAAAIPDAGLTYSYVTPSTLEGKRVSGGRLAPAGPAFKAVLVGDDAMDLPTARNLQRMVEQGLQVVFIGDTPRRTLGYAASDHEAAAQDQELKGIVEAILAKPNAQQVDDIAAALRALRGRGVRADAQLDDTQVHSVHRKAAHLDVYTLFNRSTAPITTKASLAGRPGATPYLMDPWSGTVTPIGVHGKFGQRTTVKVTIEPQSTAVVALANRKFTGRPVARDHVVSTTASDARWTGKRLVVRADDNGTVSTRLSGGRLIQTQAKGVPAVREIAGWDLRLDEWLPGLAGSPSATSRHENHLVRDVALGSWNDIDALENAVGIGTYTARVRADQKLAKAGAVLDLGAVGGSYRVFVNGMRVATPDQLGARVDLGTRLRPGNNVIQVKVASTLLNRLLVHRPDEFEGRQPTANGLLGPVQLDPYRIIRD